MTTEQRDEARQKRIEELEAATAKVLTSEGFQRFIRARSAFHDYSLNNQLLIAFQQPMRETAEGELIPTAESCSRVAGYKAWQKLGRQVLKGSKGIQIFAPLMRKAEDENGKPIMLSSGKPKMEVYGFRLVKVFDLSQTDGDELPAPPMAGSIAGEDHEALLAGLGELAVELEVEVRAEDLSEQPMGGWFDSLAQEIVIDSSVTVDEQVRVLTHELAHALGVGYEEYGRERAEVIVESATTVALGAFGFDTSEASIPYIAVYSDEDGLSKLRGDLAKIDELAARLEGAAAPVEVLA